MIEGSIRPANSYSMTLDKDATDYLNGFNIIIHLSDTYSKSKEVKQCYDWCETNMGVKYRDWFMMNDTFFFKDSKRATMFRLTWHHIIA